MQSFSLIISLQEEEGKRKYSVSLHMTQFLWSQCETLQRRMRHFSLGGGGGGGGG